MAERIKVGVVGIGALGSAHARVYHELQTCQLAAIFDIDDEKNRRTASQYNLPICRDLEELISICYLHFSEMHDLALLSSISPAIG